MSLDSNLNKKERIYAGVFVITLVFVVWANVAYEPLDWQKTFLRNDTQPYGASILYALMPYLFEGESFEAVDVPPYELVADTTLKKTSYVFLTQVFQPDEIEAEALLDFVARGNTIFAAAEAFDGDFVPLLGMSVEYNVAYTDTSLRENFEFGDSTRINLVHGRLAKPGGYFYGRDLLKSRIEVKPDSLQNQRLQKKYGALKHTVLGTYVDGEPNFMKIELGEGFVLLSTVPLAFTNYNLLQEANAEYVYASLSYLPVQTTLWDRYYKPNKPVAQTPLRFVLSSPALKIAYYFGMVLLVMFILMQIRRKQRIIPVLEARQNTTVEFAHTMGRLYFNRGDHANLAGKMLAQFRHYVQHRLFLPAQSLEDISVERVAARSGLEPEEVASLVSYMQQVELDENLDEKQLQALSSRLDAFYTHASR